MKEADQDLVMGERKFLHDISNQLVVAQGMGSFVMRSLQKKDQEEFRKEVERMQKSMGAVTKMIDMLRDRRELLHSVSDDKA